MSSYEPVCVFSLEGSGEIFRIPSLSYHPRVDDTLTYEGVTYKVESTFLELAKKGPIGDRPAFWNTIALQITVSIVP
jgi:hypothetical protein